MLLRISLDMNKNFMKKVTALSLIVLSLVFLSCNSEDELENERKPKLIVKVKNTWIDNTAPSEKVANATVLVYESLLDLKNNFNVIAEGITDEEGEVEITNNVRFDQKYYIDVRKECSNNYLSIDFGFEELYTITPKDSDERELSTLRVSVYETGTIKILNKNIDNYYVKILGHNVGVIESNETKIINYLPTSDAFNSSFVLINESTGEKYDATSFKAVCGEVKEYVIE